MATEFTPHYNLDKYTAQDKPNLRDQYNAAMDKIDLALLSANTNATEAKSATQSFQEQLNAKAEKTEVASDIATAIAPLATKTELNNAVSPLATKTELNNAVSPLATKTALQNETTARIASDENITNQIKSASFINALYPPNNIAALVKDSESSASANTTALNAMLNLCGDGTDYAGVYIPKGIYYFNNTLNVSNSSTTIIGSGNRDTRLIYNGNSTFFNVTSAQEFTVKHINIKNNVSTQSIAFTCNNMKHYCFEDIHIHNFSKGFYANSTASIGSSIFNNILMDNTANSILTSEGDVFYLFSFVGNVNAITAMHCTTNSANHNACVIDADGATDIWIYNGNFAGTTSNAINIRNSRGDIHVHSCVIDQSYNTAIRLGDIGEWGASIIGCWFSTINDAGNMVQIVRAKNIIISACNFGNTAHTVQTCIAVIQSNVSVNSCSMYNCRLFINSVTAPNVLNVNNCQSIEPPDTATAFIVGNNSGTDLITLVGNYASGVALIVGESQNIYGIMNAAKGISGNLISTGNKVLE